MILIAEIGNNHFGSVSEAMELIRIAKESGADLAKGQAFRSEDITSGSMSGEFYKKCALTEEQYLDILFFGESIGIKTFFSIFSPGFDRLASVQNYQKLAASQSKRALLHDKRNSFISFNQLTSEVSELKKAKVLYASDYFANPPNLLMIEALQEARGAPAGYSDHTVGIGWPIRAVLEYGANVIEKHFTLKKNMEFSGAIFRDTVHGSDPKELERLSRAIK